MREPASLPQTDGAGFPWRPPTAGSLAISLVLIAVASAAAFGLSGLIPVGSLALIFLVAVLLSAIRFGLWAGMAAAGLAFLAYNFFFVEPVMTFRVANPQDLLALAVFLLVAGLSGSLAGRLSEQAAMARERARLLAHLCDLSIALGVSKTESEARGATLQALRQLTSGEAVLLERSLSADPALGPEDVQAAERALRRGVVEKAAASGWSAGRYNFYPLVADDKAPLVAGVEARSDHAERDRALRSAVEQAGAAILRLRLAGEAADSRRMAEQQSIRAALLSSLSHDLKTPLATILGSVTTLQQFADALPEAARNDLLRAIETDARRLNTYVGNLLQMTRLQSGLDARLEWSDPGDILNAAVDRLRREHPGRQVVVRLATDPPLMRTDAVLLEQALYNCLDNAAAIAPPGTPIRATLELQAGCLGFAIEDDGPGVQPEEQARIFEPFQRGSAAAAGGTGLGLAIAKGIVQALGGDIGVESPLSGHGGARFRLNFPVAGGASP